MVELPAGVHRVPSGGREYFYFQPGRGSKNPGPRTRLPDDPQSPDFWIALRQTQSLVTGEPADTVDAMIDAYLTSPAFAKLTPGTQDQYKRGLRQARQAWGGLAARGVTPRAVRARMDVLADTPGKANTFLGVMRALSKWGRVRGWIDDSLTEGVAAYPKEGGHKPWTPEQIACAHESLTGMVRRGVMLALYIGQRGSDVVRLGWTDVDEGGFSLAQKKTGKEVWCPIVPELAAEMATWERRPGPFLLQANGRPYSRKLLDEHFAEQRANLPTLAGTTLHGLRSTAVIRLRRFGLTELQIEDAVGMSPAMIKRYCRFADKKTSGQAVLLSLTERTGTERRPVKKPTRL